MENFIKNELMCLRASEPLGSDRYNELTKAINWVTEHGYKDSPKVQQVDNDKFAVTTIEWKDTLERENVTIALFNYDEERDANIDDKVFFYCGSKEGYERLKHFENGEDFIVVGCTIFTESLN